MEVIKLSKSLNDISHDLITQLIVEDPEQSWTLKEVAENYKNGHENLLDELKELYNTDDKNYLV